MEIVHKLSSVFYIYEFCSRLGVFKRDSTRLKLSSLFNSTLFPFAPAKNRKKRRGA